jgi:hypothetical protein
MVIQRIIVFTLFLFWTNQLGAQTPYFVVILSEVVNCNADEKLIKSSGFSQEAYDQKKISNILQIPLQQLNFISPELFADLEKISGPFEPNCREVPQEGQQDSFCRGAMARVIKRHTVKLESWLTKNDCFRKQLRLGKKGQRFDADMLENLIKSVNSKDSPNCRIFGDSVFPIRPSRAASFKCDAKEVARCVGDVAKICNMSLVCPPGSELNPWTEGPVPGETYHEISCFLGAESKACPSWQECSAQSVRLRDSLSQGLYLDIAPAEIRGQ